MDGKVNYKDDLGQKPLIQWFSNCGTCTTGGTWAPLWWYSEEFPKNKKKYISGVKYLYYTTGSTSEKRN